MVAATRVRPGEEHYDICVESLSGSLRGVDYGLAIQDARRGCLDQGLSPGSPALAECTLRASETTPVRLGGQQAIDGQATAGPSKSYFAMSPREAFHRAQYACASLGLNPASEAFASCVANLRANLFSADNPMN